MRHPLFLLLPFVLMATRYLGFGIRSPNKDGLRSTISADTEYQALLIAIFSLAGLLVTLSLMIRFPNLGSVIADCNRF
jgi:hypothetical protein